MFMHLLGLRTIDLLQRTTKKVNTLINFSNIFGKKKYMVFNQASFVP